jgi:NAD(P)-dependent dehydrogenase (short-subunit alcohol dehydrogenase family)
MIEAQIPMGRMLQPEEIAHIAVYLASSESDGMTGQTLTISGGMRMG